MAATAGASRVAASSLQGAGLLDGDQQMRDLGDKPGGRKGRSRTHRSREVETYKDRASHPSRSAMHASRLGGAGSSSPTADIAIRGASSKIPIARRARGMGIQNNITENGITSRVRPAPTMNPKGAVEVWRAFVKRRYNPAAKFLNLENMAEDEDLRKNGLKPPGVPGAGPREGAVIFKLAAEMESGVETVSLANNKLTSAHSLVHIGRYLPKLANLSLQNNQLSRMRDLDFLSGPRQGPVKLPNLRELVLLGNPLRDDLAKAGKLDTYKHEIARRLPSIEMLDQEPVVKIAFDVPQGSEKTSADAPASPPPTYFSCEMKPSLITGVDGAVVSNFLGRFFSAFDKERSALQGAYHPAATFSFSANTTIPTRARLQGFQHSKEMPNQPKLEWGRWIDGSHGGSRNLERIAGHNDKAVTTLHIGIEEILRVLPALPVTVHDVSGSPDKFCVDAWPSGTGASTTLFVNVHGQFTELPSNGERSFDRSFVLAPAADASPAKAAGWDVVVLSDQLCIRSYSSHGSWAPGPMRVQAGDSIPPIEQLATIPEPERSKVLRLSQRTGLNVQFTVDCLRNNDWDVERAAINFEQVRGSLGKDAFL